MKKFFKSLKKHPMLIFLLVVGVLVVIFLIMKNNPNAITAPQPSPKPTVPHNVGHQPPPHGHRKHRQSNAGVG
jgi:hypothetical protein